jgi:hypothetical protein
MEGDGEVRDGCAGGGEAEEEVAVFAWVIPERETGRREGRVALGETVAEAEAECEGEGVAEARGEGGLGIGSEDLAERPDGAAVEDPAVGEVAEAWVGEPAGAFGEPFTGFEHAVAEGTCGVVFAAAGGVGEGEIVRGAVLEGEEVFHDLAEETVAVVRGGWGGAAEHGVEDGEVSGVVGECVGAEVVRGGVGGIAVPWVIVGGIEPAVPDGLPEAAGGAVAERG